MHLCLEGVGRIYMYVCMYVCTYVYVCIYVHVYMYVCILYMCVYMYACLVYWCTNILSCQGRWISLCVAQCRPCCYASKHYSIPVEALCNVPPLQQRISRNEVAPQCPPQMQAARPCHHGNVERQLRIANFTKWDLLTCSSLWANVSFPTNGSIDMRLLMSQCQLLE